MIKILKAIVILICTLLVVEEQIRNYREKRTNSTKSTKILLILACVMFVSAIIVVIGFWI